MSNIGSTISTTTLHFNNEPVSLVVTVKNLSDNYASFKVNLTAAGADPNIGDDWYNIHPDGDFIPEGDNTDFSVTILKAPILGIDLINLEVRVSSVELPEINYHNVKLYISSGVEQLQVYLPVDSFAIYPRKILDIPVRVSNPNHYQTDVILRLDGLDDRWLERGKERRLKIGAGREGEISFTCQPPVVKETPCGIYPFIVKAYVNGEEWGKARGKIEIRPIGTVFFSVTPDYNVLPSKAAWLPQLKIEPAIYLLELKNASNVVQNQITVAVEDSQCDCQVIPRSGEAKPGVTLNLNLEARKKRHWWGLKRKYPLKIIPSLSDRRLNTTDPSSHTVELWVHPLFPLWLQLGLGAIATALLLLLLSLLSVKGHSDRVNSVTFNNSINPILSGSKDGTVLRWKATPDNILCKGLNWQRFCLQHQDKLKLLDSSDAINVVELRSDSNKSGNFALLGFDSGKASKFDFLTQTEITIIDNQDSSNRIFDITFKPDLETIYLGRGTGLLPCELEQICGQNLISKDRSIHVVTLIPDQKSILAGGQANEIFMVEIDNKNRVKNFNDLHPPKDTISDKITGLKFTNNNLLISADNRGLLQIWNFNNCLQGKCDEPIYSNQTENKSGINAIALTKDKSNKYYLVTAHSQGNIKLWSFREDLDAVDLNLEETIEYPQPITSIDIIHQPNDNRNRLLILSGSQDRKVRLDIYNIPQ